MRVDFGAGVSKLRLTVLADNTVNPLLRVDEKFEGCVYHAGTASCLGEHGLSLLLQVEAEDGKHVILFDTCGPKETVINNMKELKINPLSIEKVVVSHGHYDHFGSLIRIMEMLSSGSEVILHPDVFNPKYALRGVLSGKSIRLDRESLERLMKEGVVARLPQLSRERVEHAAQLRNLEIVETSVPVELAPGVWASGEIPAHHTEEPSAGLYTERDNEIVPDSFRDEKSIYVKVEGKGTVILTGCCHKGVINTIEDAQRLSKGKIYAIIGGLHMNHASQQRINWTIEKLREADLKIISPLHCSGLIFAARLLNELPEKTVTSAVGTTFTF